MAPQNTFRTAQTPRPAIVGSVNPLTQVRVKVALMVTGICLCLGVFIWALATPKPTNFAKVEFPDKTVDIVRLGDAHLYEDGEMIMLDDYDQPVKFLKAVESQDSEKVNVSFRQ
ncbi:hypothetical protein GCM10028806_34520 [Spirosoma terrae]|uniref:Uncharacterized protein n=1 Tax=Spirosoma terrae TaxID=1968276 RepID=A0A6L9L5D8_9BACT|nr:hypothetical protein [Spirosoma terrae]NDU95766.1 hypothetical protein [Spirosoma terrae]